MENFEHYNLFLLIKDNNIKSVKRNLEFTIYFRVYNLFLSVQNNIFQKHLK